MIGRNKEYQFLEKIWATKDAFLLISGRKYIGKTTLVRSFIQDKNALYFSAQNVSDTINRNHFKNLLNHNKENYKNTAVSWKELFKSFCETSGTERKILVIDNFHYLAQANKNIIGVLKAAWENYFQPNFVMLIIVVPKGQHLLELLNSRSFTSKLSFHIDLKPISFSNLMKEMSHHEFNQLLMLYAMTGGIPKHWDYFENCISKNDFINKIEELFYKKYGVLMNEVSNIVNTEFGNNELHHSLMYLLAHDVNSVQDLCLNSGYKVGEVNYGLNVLAQLGIIEHKKSIDNKKNTITRNSQFEISDNMLLFWYRFVYPYYDSIIFNSSAAAKNELNNSFNGFIQSSFLKITYDLIVNACKKEKLPFSCDEIGYYSYKDTSIDIVAVDHIKKTVLLGDCMFKEGSYDLSDYEGFINKCDSILAKITKMYKGYSVVYGVFSNNCFDKNLLDYALNNDNVFLYNGITFYSINE